MKQIIIRKIEVRKNFYKYLLRCNQCKKEFYLDYSSVKVNDGGKFCSKKCYAKWQVKNQIAWNKGTKGLTKANSGSFKKGVTGELSGHWKGGRRQHSLGYIKIYSPDHPFTSKDKTVLEHRLIAEKILKRFLSRSEVIHHIDFNPSNNEISNLHLFTSSEHKRYHMLKDKPFLKSNLT